jgi:hypothetical protein
VSLGDMTMIPGKTMQITQILPLTENRLHAPKDEASRKALSRFKYDLSATIVDD